MALVNCFECRQPISDQAKTCVHCGARNAKYVAPDRPVLRVLGWGVLSVVVLGFALLAYGCQVASTPEGQERIAERRAIETCEQAVTRAKDDPRTSRETYALLYDGCERMKAEYRQRWQREP